MALAKENEVYDATYLLGKTVVHIKAPPPMSKEEVDRRVGEIKQVILDGWAALPLEKQLEINEQLKAKYSAG